MDGDPLVGYDRMKVYMCLCDVARNTGPAPSAPPAPPGSVNTS